MGIFSKWFGKKTANQGEEIHTLTVDCNRFFETPFPGNTKVSLQVLGELNLPSGQIVACDPLVGLYDTPAFTRSVQPGRYPVVACVAHKGSSGDLYAAVKLEFTRAKAVTWEMALLPGENPDSLATSAFLGYPVDAGLGCFCDADTQALYNQWQEKHFSAHPEGDMYSDFLEDAFRENAPDKTDPYAVGTWLDFHLPESPGSNIIMFNSGYGDGSYPCYWGMAADGSVCSLVTDFLVI